MPTRGQSTPRFDVSGGTGLLGSFSALPAAGSLIVVGVIGRGAVTAFANGDVTDNQGNNYFLAISAITTFPEVWCGIWYTVTGATVGTFEVSVNPLSGGTITAVARAIEFVPTGAGWNISNCLDRFVFSGAANLSPTTNLTLPTVRPDEVIAAVFGVQFDQGSITVQSVTPAWNQEYEELDYDASIPGEFDTRIVTAMAQQSATWLITDIGAWASALATFREQIPVTPPPTGTGNCCTNPPGSPPPPGPGPPPPGRVVPPPPTEIPPPWIPSCVGGGLFLSAPDPVPLEDWDPVFPQ